MPKPSDVILRNPTLERALLEYCLQLSDSSTGWWGERVAGTTFSRRDCYTEWRARYDSRRSVAQLYQDAKDKPFPRGSNIGIGVEQIFGEFLIPTFLANTHDLEPCLQAVDRETGKTDQPLTDFHDSYQREWFLNKRALLERSMREMLTVGGCYHKWTWGSLWKQVERPIYVFAHPVSGPVMLPNQKGEMDFMYADPAMPEEAWPVAPDGKQLRPVKLPTAEMRQVHEGPRLTIRPYESIEFQPGETRLDPNEWDWMCDNFTVSAFYFLGKEGDPFEGKYQNIDKLYQHYKIQPDRVTEKPGKELVDPIPLKEFHMKFPVTASKRPVEIIAVVAPEPRLLLGWRLSPFVRRPYFNRQVRIRRDSPLGIGIPETVAGLRNAIDATFNQEIDHRNIYGHPPVLLSSLAMLDDEEYERVGPGTLWVMGGTLPVSQAAATLPVPPTGSNSVELLNWLIGQTQRLWGVTDLNMNAPTSSLSPNIQTLGAVREVLNQGNIKFGHMTKRISETDTKEFDFQHEMWRAMMSNTRTAQGTDGGITVDPGNRETFFRSNVTIRAVGNGLSTNPILRSQALVQVYQLLAQDPFIAGDMDVRKDLDEQLLAAMGVKLSLKTSDEMKFLQLVSAVMRTPGGQQRIVAALGQSMQELQAMGAGEQQQAQPGNGATPKQRMNGNVPKAVPA